MDGISVKQSIEIETKGYATLMMGVAPAGQFKIRFADSGEHEIDWRDVQALNKFLAQVLDRDIPEGTTMAILKHAYKVTIIRTGIGYDIFINEFATDGTRREYERRHHTWALTSHGADRAAQRLISRIKRQNQRDEHPREYTIE